MPDSADLAPSPTWQEMGAKIETAYRAGEAFEDILEMNVAIKMRDLEPYQAHRERLDGCLWFDDTSPKRIIDFGAGYGAMANFWPAGADVTNIDLPIMLEIQQGYLADLPVKVRLMPFTAVDTLDIDGAYFFAAWSLTETTPETWRYWIERAPRLAGAYVLGFKSWQDITWPWDALAGAFKTIRRFEEYEGHSMLLCAVNR